MAWLPRRLFKKFRNLGKVAILGERPGGSCVPPVCEESAVCIDGCTHQ
jgi:hypothetical protein